MKYLFIHQNFPGQFKHVVEALSKMPDQKIVAIVDKKNLPAAKASLSKDVVLLNYTTPTGMAKETHQYLRTYESAIRRGQQVARVALALKEKKYEPDIICVHTGWGEALFLKEIFPKAKIIGYFEFFYRAKGADVGFDQEFDQHNLDDILRIKIRNSHHLLSYECCDSGLTPTLWQHQQLPNAYKHKVNVIHEGIDTELIKPNKKAVFKINEKVTLTSKDQVITFVNRNLEPYRGFHIFMRALPKILSQCPNVSVVLVGGNDVSYGRKPANGGDWKSVMMDEVGTKLDLSRVHFVGTLPYERYLNLLQISSAHVYLTYPFVLSWSMLEAMAMGCIVIGSDTAPVKEVISHEVNGLLVDFFNHEKLASTIIKVINNQNKYKVLGENARQTILKKYDLKNICLPSWLNELVH